MLTIYSDNITSRLRYITEVIFEDLLNCPIILTSDKSSLSDEAALNYSNTQIDGIPFIRPHALLFENGIRTQQVDFDQHAMLFTTDSDIVDQDVFASIFYLISRYEEYLETEMDELGRMRGSTSLMSRSNLLERPLVDEWALDLYTKLRSRFPSLPPTDRKFTVLPTFDIDVAYCYKGRGWWRRIRSL